MVIVLVIVAIVEAAPLGHLLYHVGNGALLSLGFLKDGHFAPGGQTLQILLVIWSISFIVTLIFVTV